MPTAMNEELSTADKQAEPELRLRYSVVVWAMTLVLMVSWLASSDMRSYHWTAILSFWALGIAFAAIFHHIDSSREGQPRLKRFLFYTLIALAFCHIAPDIVSPLVTLVLGPIAALIQPLADNGPLERGALWQMAILNAMPSIAMCVAVLRTFLDRKKSAPW